VPGPVSGQHGTALTFGDRTREQCLSDNLDASEDLVFIKTLLLVVAVCDLGASRKWKAVGRPRDAETAAVTYNVLGASVVTATAKPI
jgi:hypothetical protein